MIKRRQLRYKRIRRKPVCYFLSALIIGTFYKIEEIFMYVYNSLLIILTYEKNINTAPFVNVFKPFKYKKNKNKMDGILSIQL